MWEALGLWVLGLLGALTAIVFAAQRNPKIVGDLGLIALAGFVVWLFASDTVSINLR